MVLRHLTAILALPFVVLVVVPGLLLTSARAIDTRWSFEFPLYAIPLAASLVLLLLGFWLFATTVRLFATVGQGTLAPWDPTRKLVVVGPYRYTRNPMITGVLLILLGTSLMVGSIIIGSWAVLFFMINHLYFIVLEEPGLLERFGDNYKEYKQHVPRWFPRLAPWTPEGTRHS